MLEVPADQLLMGSAKLKFSLLFEFLDYLQRFEFYEDLSSNWIMICMTNNVCMMLHIAATMT